MQSALILSRYQEMEERLARYLKWSNAKGRSAECVQNPIRSPGRCYKRGHETTVDGKRLLFENIEEPNKITIRGRNSTSKIQVVCFQGCFLVSFGQ
jgi:hypothetical protein